MRLNLLKERYKRMKNLYKLMQEDLTKYNLSTKTTPSNSNNKVGRNDPCPCGSGKKYKKCCGADTDG